jgi:hypothetical protein
MENRLLCRLRLTVYITSQINVPSINFFIGFYLGGPPYTGKMLSDVRFGIENPETMESNLGLFFLSVKTRHMH